MSSLQILGGVTWAVYELVFLLLFFESIGEEERRSALTICSLINTTAWVAGSWFGGTLLFAFDTSFNGYWFMFAASSVERLATVVLLARVPQLIPTRWECEPLPSTPAKSIRSRVTEGLGSRP